jgi:tetrapyrrole methylase family protein/MazG family protein
MMMNKIIVVGLGPGGPEYLTQVAEETLINHQHVYLRTDQNPIVRYLKSKGVAYESYDPYYEQYDSFEKVYDAIVQDLIHQVQLHGTIVYAVPGNPIVEESTVERLVEYASTEDYTMEWVYGTSFIDIVMTRLKIFSTDKLEVINGLILESKDIDLSSDLMISQVYNRFIASDIKLKLLEYYPEDYLVKVIKHAGIADEEEILTIPLSELDRLTVFDHLTTLYIPKMEVVENYYFHDLVNIMKTLRSEDGCPWDRKQTHDSLLPYLIEEAYEVVEAVEEQDIDLLEEELGDLLLQIIFHSEIALEEGYFTVDHVIDRLVKKLISRHPHVFEDQKDYSPAEVKKHWEAIKREEKNNESVTDSLKRIPNALPSLIQAYKVQNKAARVGFDWEDVQGPIDKLHEEVDEFIEAFESEDQNAMADELGDLIFTIVNIARFIDVRPELALRKTIDKFIKRFESIEASELIQSQGFEKTSLKAMDELWNLSKK